MLEPDAHPAVKPFKDALAHDGIPFTSFGVDDVRGGHFAARGVVTPRGAALRTVDTTNAAFPGGGGARDAKRTRTRLPITLPLAEANELRRPPPCPPGGCVDFGWYRRAQARTGLLADANAFLTRTREAVIAVAPRDPANSNRVRRDASPPQEPVLRNAPRSPIRNARARVGSGPRGSRRSGSSAAHPARDPASAGAPGPPRPWREGAQHPLAGRPSPAWRRPEDPRRGRERATTASTP